LTSTQSLTKESNETAPLLTILASLNRPPVFATFCTVFPCHARNQNINPCLAIQYILFSSIFTLSFYAGHALQPAVVISRLYDFHGQTVQDTHISPFLWLGTPILDNREQSYFLPQRQKSLIKPPTSNSTNNIRKSRLYILHPQPSIIQSTKNVTSGPNTKPHNRKAHVPLEQHRHDSSSVPTTMIINSEGESADPSSPPFVPVEAPTYTGCWTHPSRHALPAISLNSDPRHESPTAITHSTSIAIL